MNENRIFILNAGRPASRHYKWGVLLGLIGPINLLMSLDRQAMILAAPRIQELYGFSFVQISEVVSCVLWTYALLQIPAGALVNAVGPRRALFVACSLWSIATLLTPYAVGFYSFILVRMAMGAGQAPDWAASIVSVDNWFNSKERSKANSVLLGFLYLGLVIGGPLTTLIATRASWRLSFFLYGIAGLLMSGLWLCFFRDAPGRKRQTASDGGSLVQPFDMPSISRSHRAKLFLGSLQFWSIGLHYMALLTIQSFFLIVMPFYLMSARHISYNSMGWLYGLPWLALYLSVFASGAVADSILRRSGSIWLARTPMGVVGTLFSGLSVAIGCRIDNIFLMVMMFCLSLGFMGLSQVSIWTSVQDLTKAHTGIVAGWTTFWGNAASGVAPIAMAYIEHVTGSWPLALSLPMIAGIAGALCCMFTHPERAIMAE